MQGAQGSGRPTGMRTRRGGGPTIAVSRGPGGSSSIFFGTAGGGQGGPGDQFLQSLLSNLAGGVPIQGGGPGQFQFLMGGGPQMYGNPGDYAWGRGGFDAIVTQLLNQMEGTGPPRMEKGEIGTVPTIKVTQEHIGEFHLF